MSLKDLSSALGDYPDLYPHKSKAAMALINHSDSWGAKRRMKDSRLIAEGKNPIGPVWSTDDNGRIVYFHKDLLDWVRRRYIRVLPQPGKKQSSNTLKHNGLPPAAA